MSPTPLAVSRIQETVRRYVNGRAGLGFMAWILAAVSLVMALAWLLAGRGGWQSGSPIPLVLDALIVAALIVGWRAVQTRRSEWLAERPLSRSMERAAGLPRGTVLESLELERAVPRGTSEGLAHLAVSQTAASLGADAATLAGASGRLAERWFRGGLRALAVTLPIALLVLAFAPARATQAWAGLLRPVRLLAGEVLPALVVTPGSVEIARGAPVQIDVVAVGREEVTLHWREPGDVPRSRVETVADDRAAFPFVSVDAEIEYWAAAPDGAVSEVYTIRPADPLLVTDVAVSLEFPAHTGRPAEEYRGAVPALALPVGTRLTIAGRASRPLLEARLADVEGGLTTQLDVNGAAFGGAWTPRRSGTYEWTFLDAAGERPGVVPAPLVISVIADAYPTLRVLFPAPDTVIPITRRQPIVADVRDDYGLDRLEVEAFRPDGVQRTVQPLALEGLPAAIARPLLDLSEWSLVPGDSVLYRLRLVDNAPGGQVTVSEVRVLRVPTVSELRRDAQEELEAAVRRLEELTDRARRAAEGADPSQSEQNRSGDFSDREAAESALDRQREMSSEVEELAAELERLADAMNEGGLADQDLQKDLDDLQQLLNEMNSDDLQQQMDDLESSLSEEDSRQAMEELRQMMENQEEFRKMLEDSLERFRRAAVEQDFRATREEAEELARKEQALSEAMKEGDDPERRTQQQRELEAEAETLQERMERLQENLEQLGEQQAQRSAQEASSLTEQARESMQQAAQAETGEQAGERAEQAADELQQAADALQEAQDRMAEELTKQIQAALQQTSDGALALAQKQAELRDQMRGATREELAELRADQAAITEGARNMADNLEEGLRFSPMDAPGVSELIEAAREESDRTANSLGRRGASPSPAVSADRTVHALNQLAMSAMTAAEQVAQAAQQQQQQQGGEQSQQDLDELAEQQADLMNQSAQMMPMQLSQQAMAEQLQQMAQGQQAVASDLGEMSDEPGAEQAMGDMEGLAQEAQAIAELLASGRLDRETLERQEQLFHKLLEAGRSLERDEEEESEERKSEAPGAFERGAVSALSDADLNKARYPLPSAEYLSRLSPGERRLVLQYFERLNRQTPPPGGVIR